MSGVWAQLGLVAVLVVLNAAFAGSELALVSLREGQLRRLEARGRRGAALARLAREPNRYLATIQIGITLAGFLASASAAVSLSRPLQHRLGFLGDAAEAVAIFLVTLVLAYVTLVVGELAPKRVAMQRSEAWALLAARPLAALAAISRPAVWLLSVSSDIAVRLMGGDPTRQREEVTEEELRDLLATQHHFTAQQRRIIAGALDVAERHLNEVMRPRPEVVVLDASASCDDAVQVLVTSRHSRAPVAEGGDLDRVIGVTHLRDLIAAQGVVSDRMSEVLVLPESVDVLAALREMQIQHQQLAVVMNEHGAAEGIVTIEDLLEELVGEIYDETDRDVLAVRHDADGTIVVPGRFPIHDLVEIGVEAPDGDYATVAGLVLARLGHIPEPGEETTIGEWTATVAAVHGRAITEVSLRRGTEI
jgi:putative hemolysin